MRWGEIDMSIWKEKKLGGRFSWLSLFASRLRGTIAVYGLLWVALLIFGLFYRAQFPFAETLGRSLNAMLPVTSMMLGISAFWLTTRNFFLFCIGTFAIFTAFFVIAYAGWLGLEHFTGVLRAIATDLQMMPIVAVSGLSVAVTARWASRREKR